jgi:hypothetical protein
VDPTAEAEGIIMDYSTSAVEHIRLIDFLQNESGI